MLAMTYSPILGYLKFYHDFVVVVASASAIAASVIAAAVAAAFEHVLHVEFGEFFEVV